MKGTRALPMDRTRRTTQWSRPGKAHAFPGGSPPALGKLTNVTEASAAFASTHQQEMEDNQWLQQ